LTARPFNIMNENDRTDDASADQTGLPDDVRARWDALADAAKQMASATGDDEGFRAAFNAMGQAARGLDHQQLLNTVHVPEDGGEHTEALRGMLVRIPDGWGRWISCSRGWYPLLVELDEQLGTLLPNYVIHQVKEKFGGLRYYWESGEDVRDPDDPEPSTPGPEGSEDEWAEWRGEHEVWCERLDAYQQTPEGRERIADLKRRIELAEKLVDTTEKRAAITCELCGEAARMHCTPAPSPWYKTLCPACAERECYMAASEWAAWWKREKPRHEASMRAWFIDDHSDERVLVATADAETRVALPQAAYIHDAEKAAEAANEDWGMVFAGDDEVGSAFCRALRARHADHEAQLETRRDEAKREGKTWFARKAPAGCPQVYYLHNKLAAHDDLAAIGVSCWSPQAYHRAGPVLGDDLGSAP
jgi:hypothetical protein